MFRFCPELSFQFIPINKQHNEEGKKAGILEQSVILMVASSDITSCFCFCLVSLLIAKLILLGAPQGSDGGVHTFSNEPH